MKEIKLEIRIHSLQYDELTPQDRELIDKAKEATSRSYAPYSKFSVGAAALLKNGVIVTGTNQENAAYPSEHVPNVPHCFMPIPSIPTSLCRHWPSPPEVNPAISIHRFLLAEPAAGAIGN